jgi:hypothetical protein
MLSGDYMQTSNSVYNLSGPQYSHIGLSDFTSLPVPQALLQHPTIPVPAKQTNSLSILKMAHWHHKTSSLALMVVSMPNSAWSGKNSVIILKGCILRLVTMWNMR